MPRRDRHAEVSYAAHVTLIGFSVIAGLYFAGPVLIPLALATLATFILAPTISRLERWGLKRILAVLLVVGIVTGGLFGLGALTAHQFSSLAEDLPVYHQRIEQKLSSINQNFGTFVNEALREFRGLLKPAAEKVAKTEEGPRASDDSGKSAEPMPVAVINDSPGSTAVVAEMVGAVASPLGAILVVAVLAIFMLVQREDLRNRIVAVLGAAHLLDTTQVLDEAGARTSKYLRMLVVINALYGVTVAAGMTLFGMPAALVWGIIAAILRFVPYIGPAFGSGLPVLMSVAVLDGWTGTIGLAAFFIIVELVLANVIEPMAYGSSTGLSAMGVLVSAIFWAWLWGAPGLILATPLTVCITVLARFIPQLSFFDTLLSEKPILPQGAVVYQRLLADDQDEAEEFVVQYAATHSAIEACDEVLLPCLSLAEADFNRGALAVDDLELAQRGLQEIFQQVQQVPNAKEAAETDETHVRRRIICIPAHNAADELACGMLADIARSHTLDATVLSAKHLASEIVALAGKDADATILISAVPPFSGLHARYLCKRLRAENPHLWIIVGFWQENLSPKIRSRTLASGADKVVTTFAEALTSVGVAAPKANEPEGSEVALRA